MEQIASLEKLREALAAIRLTDDYVALQNLITELHFAYQAYRFGRALPSVAEEDTLWKAAYYLLTALTNPHRRSRTSPAAVHDGLAIAGLVFELLGRYYGSKGAARVELDCFVNAALSDTLSGYEANSAVLAQRYFQPSLLPTSAHDFLTAAQQYGLNIVFAVLSRRFFWLQAHASDVLGLTGSEFEASLAEDFWWQLSQASISFATFMIAGDEQIYQRALDGLASAHALARDQDLLTEHWVASRLSDCFQQMAGRSVWRVLRAQGFADNYISTMTGFPWNPVHELWDSQLHALEHTETPTSSDGNMLSDDIKRLVISMPTSAGKTLLAELLIVRALLSSPGQKCVYVAPTRALVEEVEGKLHRRLRHIGYRVASVVGGFDAGGVEEEMLQTVDVAVLTPEKLDYLFRKRDPFVEHLSLLVFDEMHKVSEGERGWFLETLISWLLLKPALTDVKIAFMSAVLSTEECPYIRSWIGQSQSSALVHTDWSPTRRLVGILSYTEVKPNWNKPLETDALGNRRYEGTFADLTYRYDIGSQHRTLAGLYALDFWVNSEFHFLRREHENRYQRCWRLIGLLDPKQPILVYFQEKRDITRFCRRAAAYVPALQDARLARLIAYVTARLGAAYPLVECLHYGVAFHHGDLPVDVRGEIEQAYRERIVRVLACTTTLAEGVNLPIEVFILGYHQTQGQRKHRLSVRDFKNIVGRVGRALIETEGEVLAIRHPEFSRDDDDAHYFESLIRLDESQLAVDSFLTQIQADSEAEIVAELNLLTQAISTADSLADLDYPDRMIDVLERLQIVIFTLVEDGIIDGNTQSLARALNSTLLFTKTSSETLRSAITALSGRFVAACALLEANRLRRFNRAGLVYKSNLALELLARQIAARAAGLGPEQYTFDNIITRDELVSILSDIREARPRRTEYSSRHFRVIESVDHYGILMAWLGGSDFAQIRDTYFAALNDAADRSEVCQAYISKQFTYRLPWVFSALHAHIEQYGNSLLSSALETIPAQVKYGVDTAEAVYFSSVGIQSRFLARRLSSIYREERGPLRLIDWEPIEQWFVDLSPFHLRDRGRDLPDLSIRQAIRRVNAIRTPTAEIASTGHTAFNIAGWQYYEGEQVAADLAQQLLASGGARVALRHEPDNEYDEYAVIIVWENGPVSVKLGYVPRTHNEEIAVLLALGSPLEAWIAQMGQSAREGWRAVQVRARRMG
jgi:helicase